MYISVLILTTLLKSICTEDSMVLELLDENKILVATPVKIKTVNAITECHLICLSQNQQCTSVNIIITNHTFQCQILNVGKWSPVEQVFKHVEGGAYYQVVQKNGIIQRFPKDDCLNWKQSGYNESGVYQIKVNKKMIKVYCDMETDGGGWTVFQKRFDGTVDFDRTWKECRDGFGNIEGEFWLGNELLYILSNRKINRTEFWYEGTSFSNEKRHVKSKNFKIKSEREKYSVQIKWQEESFSNKDLPSWTPFSTKDQDNDVFETNCAIEFGGPWWHHNCFTTAFNGPYPKQYNDIHKAKGIIWYSWLGWYKSLKGSKIMIR